MAKWSDLAKFRGMRVSPIFTLNLDGDGAITNISWESNEPEGTNIAIETSVSFDGGYDWTDWKKVENGGMIPDLESHISLKNVKFRYRVFESTNEANLSPSLTKVTFYFEPIIYFENKGDRKIYPEIWITKTGNGDISIINTSNGNQEFKFTNLLDGEKLYIHGERRYIETSLPMTYRYSNFNNEYLEFVYGENILRVVGNAQIQFRYQYKYLR